MTSASRPARTSRLTITTALVSVCLIGCAIGWVLRPGDGAVFDYVLAPIEPALLAAMCIILLVEQRRGAGWIIALLHTALLVTVMARPHSFTLLCIGAAASATAVLTALSGRRRLAIVATAVVGLFMTAALLAGTTSR